MRNLSPMDFDLCLRRLPSYVLDLMKEKGESVVLAGGFIRSVIAKEKASDIDLFVKTLGDAQEFATALKENLAHDGKLASTWETENAVSVAIEGRAAVQFIFRWSYESPDKVIDSFDFTIAKAAIWYSGEWRNCCDDAFYEDLAARRVVYLDPPQNLQPGGSLLRLLKFSRRGYNIPLNSLALLISRLLLFTNTGQSTDLTERVMYFLREVDPATPSPLDKESED